MRDRLGLPALLISAVVSTAGTRISHLAVPWLVLTTTHDPVLTGLVGTAEIAPYVVLQLLGAPVVDRVGARRVAWVGNVVAGLAMALIPVLHAAGALPIPAVLALVFVAGAARDQPTPQRRCSSLEPRSGPARRSSAPQASSTAPSGSPAWSGRRSRAPSSRCSAPPPSWRSTRPASSSAPSCSPRCPSSGAVPASDAGVRGYVRDVREGLRFVSATR